MNPANEKFKFEQVVTNNRKVIQLIGDIDEDTDLQPLIRLGNPLIFNFSRVKSINSCGVRSWVNLLKELANVAVYYMDCPPLIVRQMNMVPSFVGHAQILSVYVPFVCDNCDSEKQVLVTSDKFSTLAEMPASPCEECGTGERELDGHPEQYIAFTRS